MTEGYQYYKMFGFNRKFKIPERNLPPDVVNIFVLCTNQQWKMFPKHFQRFLTEFQLQKLDSVSLAKSIMTDALKLIRPNFTDCYFTLEDFFNYLFLDHLNGPIIDGVHHDMTAPLQHYFIYTGHNSYLTGNQLNSDCSEVPIIKALLRGVRVIELDLWPNSTKDGIHVLHGWTMTTPVALDICLKSIKEHAFKKSPYPVIITLEDHLTPNLQAKVAEMVTEIFGDMLYCPKEGDRDEFPSPEDLKYHIILSTKPPKQYLERNNGNHDDNTSNLDQEHIDFKNETEDVGNEQHEQKTTPEYIQLIGIHAAKANKDLKKALTIELGKSKRLSLSEQKLEEAASQYGNDLVRFTQKNILRVFPKGTRVTSSNFRPLLAWMHGAQMVASNMQGYDKSLWMMHGMFKSNGGCGYVKKPDFLMSSGPNNEVFDPTKTFKVKKTLKVTICMGDGWNMDFSRTHFNRYSPPDFYIKLYMVGVQADECKKKTRVIEDDWIPYWDEEFTFSLRVPELALLKIVVREHDMFAGQTCLPVSELQTGIRSVPLHNKKGEKFDHVKLLIRFSFK